MIENGPESSGDEEAETKTRGVHGDGQKWRPAELRKESV